MNRKLVFASREIREKGGWTCSETVSRAELAERSASWEDAFGAAGLSDPCAVRLEFSVGGERILLEGKVEGRWELACSRCLAPHKVDFEGAIEETYPLTQETIDVWEEVRQAMILSLPDKSLCSPSCAGLCPRCGKDLNQGPCACAPERKGLKR